MAATLTLKKNYNIAVNDYDINLKKIKMSQSMTTALLMCMSKWLGHTCLDIIFISDLF